MADNTLSFGPAPRPRPRLSPEEAAELNGVTADLGFARGTSPTPTTEAEPAALTPVKPVAAIPSPRTRTKTPAAAAVRPATGDEDDVPLKFDVPRAVWTELRMATIGRRVTIKYLVLEALAAKGYDIDLSKIPEDGRRDR